MFFCFHKPIVDEKKFQHQFEAKMLRNTINSNQPIFNSYVYNNYYTKQIILKGVWKKTSRDVFSVILGFRPPRKKTKDILKMPRIYRVHKCPFFNPSFNIHRDKVKTVNSMICSLTLNKNKCIWVILQKHFNLEAEIIFSESIHIKLSFLA